MATSSVVIKVKYGETLRRFSALVTEDQLDLDMERLRTKICSLLNLTPDADFTLTYMDEDDDQVTLVDDEDLYDVMNQGLNPIRITVHLNVDKSARTSAKSTGSSTPRGSSSQNSPRDINPSATEILKLVPEPLCDVLSKLSLELASKASTTSPALADLINNLSKMGQSYLQPSHSPSGTTAVSSDELHDDHHNTSAREKHGASIGGGLKTDGNQGFTSEQPTPVSSAVSVPHAVKGARQTEPRTPAQHPPFLLNKGKNSHFHYMPPMGDGIMKEKEIIRDSAGKCKANMDSTKLPSGDSSKKDKEIKVDSAARSGSNVYEFLRAETEKHASYKKETNEANRGENKGLRWDGNSNKAALSSFPPMGECPFSGFPLGPPLGQAPYMPPPIQPFNWSFKDSTNGIGSIFHKGVRCDGCGVLPIIGPRFKSRVKHDYDLCSICFSQMGNNKDYTRIDFPLPYRHPWTCKGFYDPMVTHLPSMQVPPIMRPYGSKHLRSRLDSRFIMDVNVMDGTLMAPSTPFTKIWRMRNNGTLPWVRGLQLLWIGGDRFSASDSVEIEIPAEGVDVGNEIDVAVDFIAPELPGHYVSYWRMAEQSGHKFGQRVWVLIQVNASLKDSTSESSPRLTPGISPVNAGSSVRRSSPVVDLNLPPGNASSSACENSPVVNLNLDVNVEPTGDVEAGNLGSAPKAGKPSIVEQKRKIEIGDMNFPINDDLLVASDGACPVTAASSSNPSSFSTDDPAFSVASEFFYPQLDANIQQNPASDVSCPVTAASSSTPFTYSADKPADPMSPRFWRPVVDPNAQQKPASAPQSFSYPIIDMSEESAVTSSNAAAKDDDKGNRDHASGESEVEETLLKELEEMGFKQADLNKEVLRMNEYDLERSVADLCGVSGWDPMLKELQEMGFQDKETNRKLLMKNNGSIMRVVMDLIAEEKA